MIGRLVDALLRYCPEVAEILVTKNIPEALPLSPSSRVRVVDNLAPKGFAANHNAAFRLTCQPFFCSLNPDIHFDENPFPGLLVAMQRTGADLVAPMVRSPSGEIEDSIRRFPTIFSLACKVLGGADGRYSIFDGQADFHPEWVAGMFMLFQRSGYDLLGGFDEQFFLYYEDVDICARAWKLGLVITACPAVSVTHDARRASRRSVRHLRWHLASMARFFRKHGVQLLQVARGRAGLG